jgi:thiamine-phosphate pyrophosphorylase
LALEAHLHLPAWALRPKEVRGALPEGRWISVAVHDEREARDAEGADFALVSPVFPTVSKPGVAPLGPEGFARLARQLSCPAFALGGVTAERIGGLVEVGGVAVISAVLSADDPAKAVHELERSCPSNR